MRSGLRDRPQETLGDMCLALTIKSNADLTLKKTKGRAKHTQLQSAEQPQGSRWGPGKSGIFSASVVNPLSTSVGHPRSGYKAAILICCRILDHSDTPRQC